MRRIKSAFASLSFAFIIAAFVFVALIQWGREKP